MKAIKLLALSLVMGVATLSAQDSFNYSISYDEGGVGGGIPTVELPVIAVEQPQYWMLSSPGALRAYALSRVVSGDSYVWGDTMVYDSASKTWVRIEGDTPHGILFSLGGEEGTLVFKIADPVHDTVNRGGSLNDSHQNQLFYGWEYGVRPVKVGNSWRFPTSTIELQMSSQIPIPVSKDTNSARIFYKDSEGNYRWTEYMDVWDGMLYFPAEYAGENGQLVLLSNNGSILVDLRTGQEIVPAQIVTSVQAELANYSHVSDKGLASWQKLEFGIEADVSNDQSDAPVVWTTLSTARTVKFTMKVVEQNGTVVETPWQAHAFNRNTGVIRPITATAVIRPDGSFSEPFFEKSLEAGDWIIWWTTESFNQEPDYPYYYGGGKG